MVRQCDAKTGIDVELQSLKVEGNHMWSVTTHHPGKNTANKTQAPTASGSLVIEVFRSVFAGAGQRCATAVPLSRRNVLALGCEWQ